MELAGRTERDRHRDRASAPRLCRLSPGAGGNLEGQRKPAIDAGLDVEIHQHSSLAEIEVRHANATAYRSRDAETRDRCTR